MAINKIWYAVMMDSEDTDHGIGSFYIDEALAMAKSLRYIGHKHAYIAVINFENDCCIDELREF